MSSQGVHVERIGDTGHSVRVGPGDVATADVLEYACLLIQTEGWNHRDPATRVREESSTTHGWTLHDSIGEACTRLSGTAPGVRGSKEGAYTSARTNSAETMRPYAQAAVDQELNRMVEAGEWTPVADDASSGRIDYDFNDTAQSVDEVLGVLTRAREAVLQNG